MFFCVVLCVYVFHVCCCCTYVSAISSGKYGKLFFFSSILPPLNFLFSIFMGSNLCLLWSMYFLLVLMILLFFSLLKNAILVVVVCIITNLISNQIVSTLSRDILYSDSVFVLKKEQEKYKKTR